jgi:glycosyltransferase involved in cell wall biosynthesis
VRVVHCGAVLEDELRGEAERRMRENRRYVWLGALRRNETLRTIARSRLVVVSSRSEGGANVVSEAIANDVPVLSTRIEGSIGVLGDGYPGYFEVGDAADLAEKLDRAERDAAFLKRLGDACRAVKPLFDPARERAAWAQLLREIAIEDRDG